VLVFVLLQQQPLFLLFAVFLVQHHVITAYKRDAAVAKLDGASTCDPIRVAVVDTAQFVLIQVFWNVNTTTVW